MDECKAMGINVLSPDVNESHLKFSVNPEGDVRFGMAAIKSVGQAAVTEIIEERERNGHYKDIFDFAERVNLSICTKKNIESLAIAGAFDSIKGITREQFFAQNNKGEEFIDTLIRYGNKYQQDQMEAMNSLFGDDTSFLIAKPDIPEATKWSDLEKLNKERELIYYLSPPAGRLRVYLEARVYSQYPQAARPGFNERARDHFRGMVASSREGQTQRGSPYTIFRIEDYYGSYEIALFSEDSVTFGGTHAPGCRSTSRRGCNPSVTDKKSWK